MIRLALLLVLAGPMPARVSVAGDSCVYDVDVSQALMLDIRVACDAGVEGLNPVDRHLAPFITRTRDEASAAGYRGDYRVDLAAMAQRMRSIDSALPAGRSVVAVGSAWLLRPVRSRPGAPTVLRVRVRSADGIGFATAQPVVNGEFQVTVAELGRVGFSAFGRFDARVLAGAAQDRDARGPRVGGYRVVILDGSMALEHDALMRWIEATVATVEGFWRGLPHPGFTLFVVPRAGIGGVPFGRAMAGGGVSVVLFVGEHATREALRDDWVLIHELVHTGTPFVFGAPWFMEGLATYFEPLIRARSGLQSSEALWIEFMTNMPRGARVMASTGLARAGSRGWYWGGALLMLLVDLDIRRNSGGRQGLEDCLRSWRRRIGTYQVEASLERLVSACDAAMDGHVMAARVRRHALASGPVDLDRVWRDLGLSMVGTRLVVSPDAPMAWVRDAMLRGGPAR